MKTIRTLSAALLLTSGLATGASAYKGETLAKDARITIEHAAEIAQKVRPGSITSRELEKKAGGSWLRFSFDIKGTDAKRYEVGVDAKTGEVLYNGLDDD